MSQQRSLPQGREALLKSYQKRLRDDVRSILDNFTEIIKLARVDDETQVSRATMMEQENYEMQVRAVNINRASSSLTKLVSDMKQALILNDFPSVNESVTHNSHLYRSFQADGDNKLIALRDDMAADLYELEEEYYSSCTK